MVENDSTIAVEWAGIVVTDVIAFVWEEGWSSVIVYTAVGLYQIAKSKIFKVWFLTTIDCHYYSKL